MKRNLLMSDIRKETFNHEYRKWVDEKGIGSIYPPNFPEAYKDAAINAMDENGKQMCLDLLEYMAKNNVDCLNGGIGDPVVKKSFYFKGEWIDKETLFENFI